MPAHRIRWVSVNSPRYSYNSAFGDGTVHLQDALAIRARDLEAKGKISAIAAITGTYGHELGHLAQRDTARRQVYRAMLLAGCPPEQYVIYREDARRGEPEMARTHPTWDEQIEIFRSYARR